MSLDSGGGLKSRERHDVDVTDTEQASIKKRQTDVDVSQYDGATLADKITNAITDIGGNQRYFVPPTDPDGNRWTWGTAITTTTNGVTCIAPYGTRIDFTVGVGNGALWKIDGGDTRVEGLEFFASGTENPDHGILVSEDHCTINHCFVEEADIGFEIGTGSFKSSLEWCRTNNCQTNGAKVNSVSNVELRQCFIKNTAGVGVLVDDGNGVALRSCSIDSSTSYALKITSSKGYTVSSLTVEEYQTGGTTTDSALNITGSGTRGEISSGILDDKTDSRRGIRISSGGPHVISGMDTNSVDNEDLNLISGADPGTQYGNEHPLVHWNSGDGGKPSFNDGSIFALVYLDGHPAIKTDLTNTDQPPGRHVGEVRYHDGTDGTNTNAEGPAFFNGTDFISIVDGGAIA